jgi:predicted transcriptional regulator of viral defense system
LISSLAAAGWIEIIKRGTYVVKSPIFSAEISPFAIAAALIEPLAISHWSACAHYGFTTQSPTIIQASTPKKIVTPEMRTGKAHNPRGRAVWQAFGWQFEFIHVRQSTFWGFEKIWASSWQQVNITDIERTVLDLFIRPDIFGGLPSVIELFENAIPQVNIDRLIDYAIRYDTGSVIKRIGWVLETLSITNGNIDLLRNYPVKRYYLLDPSQGEGGQKNVDWKIIDNLKRI